MGRVYTVTNSNTNNFGVRKKTIGREIVIGPNAIKFVAITIFTVLAVVYLAQSTSGANKSVKIQNLTSKQDQLELEKERLQSEQTRLQSLKKVDEDVAASGQISQPITSVQHIDN